MVRFKTAFVITALGLMTLTACGEQVKEVTDAAGDVTDKAGEVTGKVTETAEGAKDVIATKAGDAKDALGGLTGLAALPAFKDNATAALDAVKAGDFATAKEKVAGLKDSWGAIADQVKEKAPEAHTAIETGVGDLSAGLESDTPNKEELTAKANNIISGITDAIGQ